MSAQYETPPTVTLDLGIGRIELEHDVLSNDLLWSIELEPGDDVTLTVEYEDGQIRTGHGRYTGCSKKVPINALEYLVVPELESPDLPPGAVIILRWG